MRRLFDLESPLMVFLFKVFDSLLLSILWIICSLPVITIGASSAALYTAVYRCLQKEESYLLRTFFGAFRENWKRSTLSWLVVLAVLALLALDAVVFRIMLTGGDALGNLYWVILALLCVALTWAAYLCAYCARCSGSVREVLRISFQLMLLHPIRALGVFFPLLGGTVVCLIAPGLLFLLPAPVCWLESRTIEAVLRLHRNPADLEQANNE